VNLVVDASICVKWVIEEDGTPQALMLLKHARLAAPDLLVAECANILWKKVRRGELLKDEALLAARLLEHADLELLPMRSLLSHAMQLAIELDHPAYDCTYLALAITNDWRYATADQRLLRKLAEPRHAALAAITMTLADAAASLSTAPDQTS
jgi:predicted nucleic acid-binding protein